MHIGVGEFEGKELKVPESGSISARALTMKEEIFTIIGTRVLEAVVLDINDAMGVYGIEAISRGASCSRFVNAHREESDLVKENLKIVGLDPHSLVINDEVQNFIKSPTIGEFANEKYDLIFFEVKKNEEFEFLTEILEKQKPSGVTFVIYPNMPAFELPSHPDESRVVEKREFEDKKVAVFMKIDG